MSPIPLRSLAPLQLPSLPGRTSTLTTPVSPPCLPAPRAPPSGVEPSRPRIPSGLLCPAGLAVSRCAKQACLLSRSSRSRRSKLALRHGDPQRRRPEGSQCRSVHRVDSPLVLSLHICEDSPPRPAISYEALWFPAAIVGLPDPLLPILAKKRMGERQSKRQSVGPAPGLAIPLPLQPTPTQARIFLHFPPWSPGPPKMDR